MLHRVIVMGRLTDNPELRHTASNIPVTTFTLAVERNFNSGDERVTDFLDVVAWRNNAEFISKYFAKGQRVCVEGSIQVRSYTDRDGNKRRAWDIVCDRAYFAEGRRDGGTRSNEGQAPAINNAGSNEFAEFEDNGDDLPF